MGSSGGGKNWVGVGRVSSGVPVITLTLSSPAHHSQDSEDPGDKGRFGSASGTGLNL